MSRWRLPEGQKLTDLAWGIIAIAGFVWLLVDTGQWARISPAWWGIAGFMGLYELYTLCNVAAEDTLSEGQWRYLPERPVVGWALGLLTAYMWPLNEHLLSGIWFFLMGHFVFYPAKKSGPSEDR